MILKEDVIPAYVTKPLYILAPMIAIISAMIGFAVVPFGPVGEMAPTLFGYKVDFQIAPYVDIGILYIFSIGSLGVYGVILAGWASNNKYSFLGGLRSSAQLISYEIPLGMSILGTVLITGSLDLNTIVEWQDKHVPGWVVAPVGLLLFFVSALAETNRLPFDLPESEQELVGGFHTEYSAMKFGMFFLGEYLHIVTASFLVSVLFLGGWDLIPFYPDPVATTPLGLWAMAFLKVGVVVFKVACMIVLIMWIRWTLPRFRYDQLMDLAWKALIPISLVNFLVTAAIVQLVRG
jgi:NADH-quinone oxidoreductase subunit H